MFPRLYVGIGVFILVVFLVLAFVALPDRSIPIDPNAQEGQPYLRFAGLRGVYPYSDNVVVDGLTVSVFDTSERVLFTFWVENAGYENAEDIHFESDRYEISYCWNTVRHKCFPDGGTETFTSWVGQSRSWTVEILGMSTIPVTISLVDAAGQLVGPDVIRVR